MEPICIGGIYDNKLDPQEDKKRTLSFIKIYYSSKQQIFHN